MNRRTALVASLILLTAAGCVLGLLTPRFAGRWVTTPDWSSDGDHIAFICHYPSLIQAVRNIDAVEGWGRVFQATEVCVSDASGRESVRLTHDSLPDTLPMWSPDGGRLAHVSSGNTGDLITVIRHNDSAVITLATGLHIRAESGSLAWSPSGEELAFVGRGTGSSLSSWNLYRAMLDEEEVRLLLSTSTDSLSPSWSGDGAHLAFIQVTDGTSRSQSAAEVHLLDLKSGSIEVLVAGFEKISAVEWNPRYDILVLMGIKEGDQDFGGEWQGGCHHVYTFAMPDQELSKTTGGTGICSYSSLVWSPDGQAFAFALSADGSYGIGVKRLADAQVQVIPVKSLASSLSWSPNGTSLVYAGGGEGSQRVWILDVAAEEAYRLPVP